MAEIKIEKKRQIWPWLLVGLAILALLLYFLVFRNKKEDAVFTSTVPVTDRVVVKNNSAVNAYIKFIDTATNNMSLDHSFTSEALLKLADAAQAIAQEKNYNDNGNIGRTREYADKVTHNPSSLSHADDIRKAADMLAAELQTMQQANYPALASDAAEVKAAAQSITPETQTLNQREAVKSFFRKAAGLLKKMN